MQNTFNIVTVFFLCSVIVFGQGDIDDEDKVFFRDESTFSIMLNSNGYGLNYRYARRQNAFKSTIYDFDYARIKSVKEKKPGTQSSGSFVYGQLNSLSTIRGGIGLQKELYSKKDKGSVAVRYYYSLGLSVGVEKPVYYIGDTMQYIRFDVNQHFNITNLGGKAPFYVGLNEMKLLPGGYVKLGFSFDYSDTDKIIKALEGAVVLDVFYRPIEIMATHKNMFYLGFIMAYRFGKAKDKGTIRSNRRIDNLVDF